MRSAAEIKSDLDRFVVGQEAAKRTVATAVANHYRAVAYQGETRIRKANLLMLGPTGSGKTFLIETVARLLEVPYAQTNATAVTPAGWAGEDPDTVVRQLVQRSRMRFGKDDGWKRALEGIVYIDEVDKMAQRRSDVPAVSAGFTNVSIQQSLLKIVEGAFVTVDGNPFPTDDILFVASGAFVGLDEIVAKREAGGRFDRAAVRDTRVLRRAVPRDLVEYGFIPEFIGRFPVLCVVEPLTEADMVAVLRDVQDSLLAQWQARLSVDGCTLDIAESVLRNIARAALAQGTGARGLQTALERLMEPVLFDIGPNTAVRISGAGIEKRAVVPSKGAYAPPAEAGEPRPDRPPKTD